MSIPVVRSLPRAVALPFGAVVLLLGQATLARAQGSPPADASPATHAAMEEVAWFVGTWQGEAWYRTPSGERQTILQTERIERRLNGQVLLVEGIGREKRADGSPGDVVHHALAVVSYDPDRGRYTFRAFKEGRSIDAETSLEDGVFTWSIEAPGQGRVRYRIRRDEGAWVETGEFSRGATTWWPFFEMRLQRGEQGGNDDRGGEEQ